MTIVTDCLDKYPGSFFVTAIYEKSLPFAKAKLTSIAYKDLLGNADILTIDLKKAKSLIERARMNKKRGAPMKITGQSFNFIKQKKLSAEATAPETQKTLGKTDAQDSITIRASASPELSESQFLSKLKRYISSEVNVGASPQKLDDLKRQIALHEYKINPTDIVRKMMLDDSIEVTND